MTTPTQPACWRDFAHTASVKLASALAAHEARSAATTRATVERIPTQVVRQSYAFALLAAATGEAPVLPTGGYEAAEGGLILSTTIDGGRIQVGLQFEGFEALETGAGHDARVVSDDGTLDASLRFDVAGHGTLHLADTAANRVALTKLRVDVLAAPEG